MEGGWPWEDRETPREKAVDDEAGTAGMQSSGGLPKSAEDARGEPRTAEDCRGRPRMPEDGRGLLSLQKLEEPGKNSTRDLRRNQPCRYLGCRLVASTGVNEYTAVGSHSECAAS